MKLTFLGTGTSQGVPVIGCGCDVCRSEDPRDKRLRTSAMIEVDGKYLVIDTGPDFRQQMLRATPPKIDAVIFTHEHKDHVAGMDDIRPFNFRSGKPLDVFASERVEEALHREYPYVFSDFRYPGAPEVNLHRISGAASFGASGIEVVPVEVLHHKLPVLGFRIGDMAYITDANYISDEEKQKLRGLDVLVLNALRKKKHLSHFNLEEAIALANELGAKRTYLTHISHLMGRYADVQSDLPGNVFLAYDGLTVDA